MTKPKPLTIIAIMAQKGGVGKTTLSTNLAIAAATCGYHTALLDMDDQGSAEYWAALRDRTDYTLHASITVHGAVPSLLERAIGVIRNSGHDFLFIDTAPNAARAAGAVAENADLILVPTKPGALDIRAIEETMALAEDFGKPAAVVLNDAPTNSHLAAHAADFIATTHNYPLAEEVLCNRVAFSKAIGAGLGVIELEPKGKAAAEVWGLYTWLTDLLGLPATKSGRAAA